MPARPSNDTLQRLIVLLKSIPAGPPGKSTSELASVLERSGYSTTTRSLQRDLLKLKDSFSLHCNDQSKPFHWHWAGGGPSGFAALSMPEALALVLIEAHLKQALPAHLMSSFEALFFRARETLARLGPNNPNPGWLKKVRSISQGLPLKPAVLDPVIQATVAEALLHERQLEVVHRSTARGTPRTHTLNPLAMILRGSTLYLAATAQGHTDVRLYAMHRILAATDCMRPAAIPRGFDIDRRITAGLGQFGPPRGEPELLALALLCDPWLARQLDETPLSADQTAERRGDDRVVVRATVIKSWQLQWWILARLDAVEVLEPSHYRAEIADLLRRGSACYE